MILKYFMPEQDFSWQKLDEMTAKVRGLWTWEMQGMITLKKMGFDVKRLWTFDFGRFAEKGENYLIERYGEEIAVVQVKYSYMPQELKIAREFVRTFGRKTRVARKTDVRRFYAEGYLVVCGVNYKVLRREAGWAGHFMLLTGLDKDNLYFHDPGLPGQMHRKIPNQEFVKAWAYPTKDEQNLMAFRL